MQINTGPLFFKMFEIMKKLLLSCDHYVFSFHGQYYVKESGLILLNRYLNVFELVRFAVRVKTVFSEKELGIHRFLIEDKRIEVYPIPFFQGPKQYASSFLRIKKTLKSVYKGVDAAIFRLPSPLGFMALNEIKNKNIPLAVEIIANPYEKMKNTSSIFHFILQFLIHQKLKKALKHANGVSYVTKSVLQRIYPPQKKDHFKSYYSSVELPQAFFYKKRVLKKGKEFVICHVTNQIKTYNKGHITLLKAIKILKEKGLENVVVKFAGYGDLMKELHQYSLSLRLKDNVEFVGYLDLNELREFLVRSDLMVFPSKTEGMPRCIVEAMATGLPCLSTPVGGIPELLPHSLLFQPNDSVGFAKKINELYQNSNLYEELSSELFEKSKQFSSEALTNRRNKFYQNLYRLTEKFNKTLFKTN